ncbi:unnamed protein product [Didymodactylos carnosus]|uniref:F-box protein n=1 Tax=Didymodactylos carnosus TaxID=1234261 RepID=A0A814FG40_9BILA|nr:unnamed protein product [Didymodactylos carnosus]CAF3753887.1 unnamed protein product [Didymodactylos carnosus]
MKNLCQHDALLAMGDKVQSLVVGSHHRRGQLDQFPVNILSALFPNLKSLCLSHAKTIESIKIDFRHLKQLHIQLDDTSSNDFPRRLFKMVLSDQCNIEIFGYESQYFDRKWLPETTVSLAMRRLTFKTYDFSHLSSITKHTPNLEYLNGIATDFYFDDLSPINLPHLTDLALADEMRPKQYGRYQIYRADFDLITAFIEQFAATLTNLSLNIPHSNQDEQISIEKLTCRLKKLKYFDYYIKTSHSSYIYSMPFAFKTYCGTQSNVGDSSMWTNVEQVSMDWFIIGKPEFGCLKNVKRLILTEHYLAEMKDDVHARIEDVQINSCCELSVIEEYLWNMFPRLQMVEVNCSHRSYDNHTIIARTLLSMLNKLVSLTFAYVPSGSCDMVCPLPTIEAVVTSVSKLDKERQITKQFQMVVNEKEDYLQWWK